MMLKTLPKSVDVEWLLEWAYRRQRADIVAEHGVGLYRVERLAMGGEPRSPMADSAAMIAEAVPGAGGVMSASALHPDAETVHETVRRMPVWPRRLLIEHGRVGSAPEWGEGITTKIVPVLRGNGKPEVVWSKNGDYQCYCKVEVLNHPAYIMALRDVYLTWWEAMVALAAKLRAAESLTSFAVTDPARSPCPWKTATPKDVELLTLTARKKFG